MAACVFSDPLSLTIHDSGHSADETRWITLGMVQNKVLVVVFTYPENHFENTIRIISARLATTHESYYYRNGADMKAEYDFSQGERGKIFIPEDEIHLPFYLDPTTEKRIRIQAAKTGSSPSELVATYVKNELDLIDSK